MQNAQKIDLGFESKNLLAMNFDLGALHYEEGRGQQFYRAAIERITNSPGMASASIASNPPLGGGFARTVFPEGRDENSGYRGTLTTVNDITPNYFDTLRIPLVRGRTFTDNDRKETAVVAIASEAMVKQYWPNENALGKRFHFFGDPTLREIVGVVANSVVNEVGEEPQPIVFLPMAQDYVPAATLQVRTTGSAGKRAGHDARGTAIHGSQSGDHQCFYHRGNPGAGAVGSANGRHSAHAVWRARADFVSGGSLRRACRIR